MVARWRRYVSTGIVASIGFFDHIEYSVIVPSLWQYLQTFGVTEEWVFSMIFALFSISVLIVAPIAGAYVDRFPMRGILLLGLLVSVGGQFMYAIAWDWWVVLVSRVICGVGAATNSILMVYVARMTTSDNRTAWSARFNLIAQCGLLLGPVFAIVFQELDFNIGPFNVNQFTAPGWLMMLQNALLFVLIGAFFVEPGIDMDENVKGDEEAKEDDSEAAAQADETKPLLDKPNADAEPAGSVSAIQLWWTNVRIIISPATLTVFFLQFILFFNQMTMETVITPLTDYFYEFTPLENALLYSGVVVVFVIVFLLIMRVAHFVQDRTLILIGIVIELITVIFSTVIFAAMPQPPLWLFFLGVGFFVAGLPFFASCISSLLTKLVDPRMVGTAQGLMTSTSMVAQIFGPLWAGTFSIAPVVPFIGVLVLVVIVSVVFAFTFKHLKIEREPKLLPSDSASPSSINNADDESTTQLIN